MARRQWLWWLVGLVLVLLALALFARAWFFREIVTGRWPMIDGTADHPIAARTICVRESDLNVTFQLRLYYRGFEIARLSPFRGIDMMAECVGDRFAVRGIEIAPDRRSVRIHFPSGPREWPILISGEPEP